MKRFRAVSLVAFGVLVIGLASVALAMKEQPRPLEPPDYAVGRLPVSGPFVILQQGDTAWVQVHTDTTYCPGDPNAGHGGEATGGPDGSETWCFEDAAWIDIGGPTVGGENVTASDTCGTNSPWDTRCFTHVDVRTFPSQTGVNFWHLDDHRTSTDTGRPGPAYTGGYALWCGSDSLWIDGEPVECGIWSSGEYPGYGNQWNCFVQLELTGYSGAAACTLAFDPRYDTECKYDYFYVDAYDGSQWNVLATFNGSSQGGSLNECGTPGGGNPDYFGFGDTGQPNTSDWVGRTVGGQPAFFRVIPPESLTTPPKFRWRFTSDGAWSDADGRGHTDGACFIDNVMFWGSGQTYVEDFEDNDYDTLAAHGWTFPDPDPVAQCWHQVHDVDPPYEGNEAGQVQSTCVLDSSLEWRGRPDGGYPSGQAWRNGWFYRLRSPVVDIPAGAPGTGCVVQYDQYICALDYTCDYVDTKVRFYDTLYGKWCPWTNIDGFITYGGCTFWNFDDQENVTQFYGPTATQMQFAWDLMDVSSAGDFCRGKHKSTDNVVDNVSIGFYDGTATIFSARYIDLFQDSFHDSICTYNSLFSPYSQDTLDYYNVRGGGAPPIVKYDQLYASITDKDGLTSVELWGSIDGGNTWVSKAMTFDDPADPANPDLGGDYYGNFCPSDFAGGSGVTAEGFWEKGIEIWCYVKAEDDSGNVEYWPSTADPGNPDHVGTREDYAPNFVMSILPTYPADFTGTKILLVDGYPRWNIDYSECMAADDNTVTRLVEIYEKTLADAGYCFDEYNVAGGGSSAHIHPLQYTDYDCVFWFTGPYFSNYLVDMEAQIALRAYLAGGGKVVFCGDQLALCMTCIGDGSCEDSLGGEFLSGVLGTEYQEEMEVPFDKPYVYLEAAPSVDVFGTPTAIDLDSLLVYRECPTLREMSYILTNSSPPPGYTAQPLLYVDNPAVSADPADGAVYVEYQDAGQLVFVNYDLSGFATHRRTECDGSGGAGTTFPAYTPGSYYGRVDLVEVILNDLFGLVPPFPGGGGGTADVPTKSEFKWALNQNFPNPASAGTEIRYEIAKTGNVSIKVYNAMGQLVSTLENRRLEPGRYSAHWDGTNSAGQRVSSGVYFYKMEAGQFAATKKMLVVK